MRADRCVRTRPVSSTPRATAGPRSTCRTRATSWSCPAALAPLRRPGRGGRLTVGGVDVLVVSGAYRYVRNPMYLAVMALIAGQGLLIGSPAAADLRTSVWHCHPSLRAGLRGTDVAQHLRCAVRGLCRRCAPLAAATDALAQRSSCAPYSAGLRPLWVNQRRRADATERLLSFSFRRWSDVNACSLTRITGRFGLHCGSIVRTAGAKLGRSHRLRSCISEDLRFQLHKICYSMRSRNEGTSPSPEPLSLSRLPWLSGPNPAPTRAE